jgi:hypothetical protein
MSEKTCSVCGRPEDLSVDPATSAFRCELRPYGVGGADICYQCAHSSPDREAEATKQMDQHLRGTLKTLADAGGGAAVFGAGHAPIAVPFPGRKSAALN